MDTATLEQLKQHLVSTNEEFRRLAEQHSEFDKKLEDLTNRHYLTEQEQLEEIRLKKLKLHLKDQMQDIIDHYQPQQV
jgi:uncharacterized protein